MKKGAPEMEVTSCSDVDADVIVDTTAESPKIEAPDPARVSPYITLAVLGLSYKQFAELSNLGYLLDVGTICNIFDMQPAEVSEVYRQAGIHRPYMEPRSMEALHCAMLWLYLTGRAQFGLNAYGKIEYLGGAIKKADRALIDMELFTQMDIASKINTVLNVPHSHYWMSKYIADAMVMASEEERRSILTDLLLNGRSSIVRPDYAELEKVINIDSLRHRRRRVCYSKFQLYCMMDRIRIEACHRYRGNRKDFELAMWGSATNKEKVKTATDMPIPNLCSESECAKTILKCLKLG